MPQKKSKDLTKFQLITCEKEFLDLVTKNKLSAFNCTQSEMRDCFEKFIIDKVIKLKPKLSEFLFLKAKQPDYISDIIQDFSNKFLEEIKIKSYLENLSNCLIEKAIAYNCKTPFMQYLYEKLKELIYIATSEETGFFVDDNKLKTLLVISKSATHLIIR